MKILTLIVSIILANIAFANTEIQLENKFVGQRFEVSHTEGQYVDVSLNYTGFKLPVVTVEAEYAGFECTVVGVNRERLERSNNGVAMGYFQVAVDWSPGADSSGCIVKIANPYTGESAHIELFMMY